MGDVHHTDHHTDGRHMEVNAGRLIVDLGSESEIFGDKCHVAYATFDLSRDFRLQQISRWRHSREATLVKVKVKAPPRFQVAPDT